MRDGVEFVGWCFDDFYRESFLELPVGTLGDIKLYAKWSDTEEVFRTFAINYELDFGRFESEVVTTYVETIGVSSLPAPVKVGYTFVGWTLAADSTEYVTSIGTDVTGDVTLKAKWEAKKFTVTFDLNGGELLEGSTVLENVAGGSTLALPTPQKTGYVFVGWYTSLDNRGVKFTENDVITNSITLYAKYESIANLESEYAIINNDNLYLKEEICNLKCKVITYGIKNEDLKRVPAHEQETADDNDDEVGATYAEQLVGVIYKLWNPPSNQLLNGRNPRVHIKIRMNRYGRGLQAEIAQKSGFKPMDYSVEELLRNLKQLPPPPPTEPTEIEFVLIPQK